MERVVKRLMKTVEGLHMTEEHLNDILGTFDSIDLDNEYHRRTAVKPLYDYFQILILEVAVRFCGQNRNSLKNCHLKARWNMTKSCLGLMEDPTRWDELIYPLHNIRSSTEHTDYKVPSKTALSQIRQRAPEFKTWILQVGKRYYEESEGFSFIQKYSVLSRWYIGQADWMIYLFGDKTPYCVEREIVLPREEHPYQRLKSLRDTLESRNREIDSIDDLNQDDLDNLVELVKVIERLDARESVLLQQNVCPKCGSNIVTSQRQVGGSPDDPTPYAVIYRIGCENCDYEVDSETIDV